MNKKGAKNLPVFMQDTATNEIFSEVAKFSGIGKAYIVGGATRNALYYRLFGKKLPQRDYDISFYGDIDNFVKNLRSAGFTFGKIRRKHEIVLKKKKVDKPNHPSGYVVLDIHISNEKDIFKNLRKYSNFTINGSVLPLKEVASKDWYKKIISLPGAKRDLKNKQLRINSLSHPANFFACLRFMSKGFKAPSQKEVKELVDDLKRMNPRRYEKNVKKIFDYVGGEKKARLLLKKLKIKEDVFKLTPKKK
jgi:tRNA nucleotidyltransferase/poly(A) polymerase